MTVEPPSAPGQASPAEELEPERPGRLRGGLFGHHDFRQLFLAKATSSVGTQLTVLAMPVLAVKVLHADAFQMGLLGTCEFLAFLVVGLPAGAWVDRWRRRRVLVANDLVRAVALASLPLAWAFGVLTLVQLLVVALVVGTCTVFFDVADQSYLPEIVESHQIGDGNAKLQAAESVAMIAGPAIAGGLIKLLGSAFTIALDAISFVGSALFVSRIRHVDVPPPREDRRPLHVEIGEGLRFVLKHPLLWRITACTSLGNFFNSMSSTLIVLYALDQLGLDAGHLGIIFGVGSVGGLLGALSASRVADRVGEGRVIPLSALAWVPAQTLVPLAGILIAPLVALPISMLVVSFVVVLYNITQVSFRQRLCPRPLLGRMNASIRFIVWGCMPIGSFIGGVLASTFSIRAVLWVSVAGAFIAALPVLLSPLITMGKMPDELDQLSETPA
ncbi:MAG: MFS transporter [Marmoricola sp.]|nr:MFS transporter [Marmoricola sp.]